ncbi:MAG: AAA domain-containing protein, partial [Acholeplasmataceae bacterium]
MNAIAQTVSQAIKEAKWLSLDYQNMEGQQTSYWCAVLSIGFNDKTLLVKAFNVMKINNDSKGVVEIKIYFDAIKKAAVLDHTTYQRPDELIKTIEQNIDQLSWLEYDQFNSDVLEYVKKAIKYDAVPYQKQESMVSGVDEDVLEESKKLGYYELSLKQVAELTEKIDVLARLDKERIYSITELAINLLSINTSSGYFVCVYKKLLFDPERRQLIIGDEILFNYEFISNDSQNLPFKHSLRSYLDFEVEEFTALFISNRKKANNVLMGALKRFNQTLDERPYIFDLVRNYNGNIEREFFAISRAKKENALSTPIKAFFGNMDTSLLSHKRSFDIVLLKELNVDQLRVVHNALKQPITYVQGPPGTGKTYSIINLLVSSLFNQQTVLVSSNNNKPIDDIITKMNELKYQGRALPLPILRLGNIDKVRESLLFIKSYYKNYSHYRPDEEKLSRISLSNKHNLKQINKIIDDYEDRLELEESIDALESMMDYLSTNLRMNVLVQEELKNKKEALSLLPIYKDEDVHKNVVLVNDSFLMWMFYTSVMMLQRLEEPKYKEFVDILHIEDENEQVGAFNRYLQDAKHLEQLLRVFPIMMTTNQSAWRIGPPKQSFDLTIIDEAGQCSIGYSLFAINRGRRLLLVGDQNQLQPVITISPEVNQTFIDKFKIAPQYDYVKNSIIRTMQSVDSISKFVMLRYHYRCHNDIINFSNNKYYHSKLIVPEKSGLDDQALFYLQVNQKLFNASNIRNSSRLEVESIIEDIKTRNLSESIGIITPFRNQANLIQERIKQENLIGVTVGTVHTFQGDEKDCIYFSTAITRKTSPKTFDWIKNNQELINVATTRAKKKFIMVGDFKEVKKRSKSTNDLYQLAQYVQSKGKEVKLTSSNAQHINGMNYRQFNTLKEKELLSTMSQILSIKGKYFIERQVKVADILRKYTDHHLFDYGTKAVFDFVLYEKLGDDDIPRLVVELN